VKKKKRRDYSRSRPTPVAGGSKTVGQPIGLAALRRLRKGQMSYLPDYAAKVRKAGK
jgi:hypothetical protein